MNIGINLLYLLPGECGGTETYGVCLLNALSQIDSTNEYFIYMNRESKNLLLPHRSNFHFIWCNVKARSRPARYLYEQLVLPFLTKKEGIDVLHSLGYVAPLFHFCKSIVTVHDTNFIDRRNDFHWIKRLVYDCFARASIRRADRIITISGFSKRSIERNLGTAGTKIVPIHLGPGWMEKEREELDWAELEVRYKLPKRYILAFGGGALHKNIGTLISAYMHAPETHGHILIILGRLPENTEIPESSSMTKGRVLCLGYVPTEHIQPLLSHADLFVFPSLYEGFGLPILEAQYAGALVASSDAASLPEVGGAGAIYFDATSLAAVSAALCKGLLGDQDELVKIKRAAVENLAKFSWKKTAEQTLCIYNDVNKN